MFYVILCLFFIDVHLSHLEKGYLITYVLTLIVLLTYVLLTYLSRDVTTLLKSFLIFHSYC